MLEVNFIWRVERWFWRMVELLPLMSLTSKFLLLLFAMRDDVMFAFSFGLYIELTKIDGDITLICAE
jgi:hypothetical protein